MPNYIDLAIVVVDDHTIVAEHTRGIGKQGYHFELWHYVPLLERKPGALRNGAPFKQWPLPRALDTLKQTYLKPVSYTHLTLPTKA